MSDNNNNTSNTKDKEYEDLLSRIGQLYGTYLNGTQTDANGTQTEAEWASLANKANEYYGLSSDYMKQYIERPDFSYDINTDKMYAMYRDQYLQNAKSAQESASAQAAGLTGGYGSSYASAMGNMAYSAEMDKLNTKASELYDNAYNKYLQDGQELLNAASLYGTQADSLMTRSQNASQKLLNDIAAAGTYADYLYQFTTESQNAAQAEIERAAMERINTATKDNIAGYKAGAIDNSDKTGWDLIGDAININKTLISDFKTDMDKAGDDTNAKSTAISAFVNNLFSALKKITISGKTLSDAEMRAYIDVYVIPELSRKGLYTADFEDALESGGNK